MASGGGTGRNVAAPSTGGAPPSPPPPLVYTSLDEAARVLVDSFGNATLGGTWTASASGSGTYGVDGFHLYAADKSVSAQTNGSLWTGDYTMVARFMSSQIPPSGTTLIGFAVLSGPEGYENMGIRVLISTNAADAALVLYHNDDGGDDVVVLTSGIVTFTANVWYQVKWAIGTGISRAKVWKESDVEPDWQATRVVGPIVRDRFFLEMVATPSPKRIICDYIRFYI